jgi:nucleoside recognition membrane protein YjiH
MAQVKRSDERTAPAERHADTDHEDHGHSIAAWSLVAIVLVGALISSVAVVIAKPWLFFVGLVVAVIGLIVGKVLQAMGFGRKIYEEAEPYDPSRPQGVR